MRRLWLSTCVLALVLAPASDARKSPCRVPKQVAVAYDTRNVVVWTQDDGERWTTRACRRRTGQRAAIATGDGLDGRVIPARLTSSARGRFLAYTGGYADHYGAGTLTGEVFDFATRHRRSTGVVASATGLHGDPAPVVHTLRLTRRGSLLVSASEWDHAAGAPVGVVALMDARGPRQLARGLSVDAATARFAGASVIWRSDGAERREPLVE